MSHVLGFDPHNIWINDSRSGSAEWVFTFLKQHNFKGHNLTKYIEILSLFKLKIQDIASDSSSITTDDSSFACARVNFYLHMSLTKDKTVRLSAYQLLGEFSKLRKAPISFVMSVCLSVCPPVRMEPLGCHWADFHEIWHLRIFFENLSKKFKFY